MEFYTLLKGLSDWAAGDDCETVSERIISVCN